jgi:sugar lactone lactonase YvrE
MKRFLLVAFVSAAVSLASAQSYNSPESVEHDPAGNRYFISNKGAGEILQRNGSGVLSVFTSLPSSPAGLHIAGNTLYVCDGARVKGYDLNSAAEVMNINLGATFLNGITGDGGNNLYVTDFTAKKIYRIDIAAQTFNLFVPTLTKTPNGIIYDGANNRLVFVTWGSNAPIYQVDLADSSATQVLATTLGSCDGITRDSQGNYYVTAWATNSMYKFDSSFSAAPAQFTTGLSSPADICFNAAGDTIAIPNSGNSTVTFVWLNSAGVGVSEQHANDIEVYPVPSKGLVTIDLGKEWKNAGCFIFDSKGAALPFEDLCTFGGQIGLSLEGFPVGVYYICLVSGDKRVIKKLVKD